MSVSGTSRKKQEPVIESPHMMPTLINYLRESKCSTARENHRLDLLLPNVRFGLRIVDRTKAFKTRSGSIFIRRIRGVENHGAMADGIFASLIAARRTRRFNILDQ